MKKLFIGFDPAADQSDVTVFSIVEVRLGAMPKKRDFTPCGYCRRYDDKVELIDSDGLKGRYHPHCHSRIIHEVMRELIQRMS